jgi:hypothetical protein
VACNLKFTVPSQVQMLSPRLWRLRNDWLWKPTLNSLPTTVLHPLRAISPPLSAAFADTAIVEGTSSAACVGSPFANRKPRPDFPRKTVVLPLALARFHQIDFQILIPSLTRDPQQTARSAPKPITTTTIIITITFLVDRKEYQGGPPAIQSVMNQSGNYDPLRRCEAT